MTNIRYDQNDNKNENNYHNHNRCNEEEQLQQKPTHGVFGDHEKNNTNTIFSLSRCDRVCVCGDQKK